VIAVLAFALSRERPVCDRRRPFRFGSFHLPACHPPRLHRKAVLCSEIQVERSPWPALKRSDCALMFTSKKNGFSATQTSAVRHLSSRRSRRRRGIALIAARDSRIDMQPQSGRDADQCSPTSLRSRGNGPSQPASGAGRASMPAMGSVLR